MNELPSVCCQSVGVIQDCEHIFLLRDQLWFRAGASVPLGAVCVAGAWRSSARTDGCADDTTDRQLFAHIFTGLLDSSLFYFVLRRMRLFAPPFSVVRARVFATCKIVFSFSDGKIIL